MKLKLSKKNSKIILFSSLGFCALAGLGISIGGSFSYLNHSNIEKVSIYYKEAYKELELFTSNNSDTSGLEKYDKNLPVNELIKSYNSLGYQTFKTNYLTKINAFKTYGDNYIKDNYDKDNSVNDNSLSMFDSFIDTSIASLNAVNSYYPTASIFTLGMILLVLPLGISAVLFLTRNASKKQKLLEEEQLKTASRKLKHNV